MAEIEAYPVEKPRKLFFNWVAPILYRPHQTLTKVVEANRPLWMTPILILSLLAIVHALVAAPIRSQLSLNGQTELPPDYQYWTPEQQQQYQDNMAANSGPLFTYVIPTLAAVAKVWLAWVVLGAILHLVMTLSGGRASMMAILNIIAWASIPLIFRYIVQIIGMLSTHSLINNPGLAGFAPAGATGLVGFLSGFLQYFDLYFFWQIALIIVGLYSLSGLSPVKVWASVLVSVFVILCIGALPNLLSTQLGGLSLNGYFF